MPIVTPNWNLPTPALTDAYNLVGDLATFSSAVDGAITSVANARKGTAAQRIAAASTSVDGVLWQDTDGIKMLWRRDGSVGGSWAPVVTRWAGTTAQMNAFTQAPNGFEWFDTSRNLELLRIGGAWRAPIQRGSITPRSVVAGGATQVPITFTVPFTTTPSVVVSTLGDVRDVTTFVSAGPSLTGATIGLGSNSTVSRTFGANWVAYGE